MARPATVEPDPDLLLVAAHELGHAVVDTVHGLTVLSIEVDRRNYTGLTTIDFDDATCTAELLRGALLGSVAGYEAERLWCHHHGGQPNRRCSRTDFTNFTRNSHRVGLTLAAARARARVTLVRDWPRIERLAPHLARRGHVNPW